MTTVLAPIGEQAPLTGRMAISDRRPLNRLSFYSEDKDHNHSQIWGEQYSCEMADMISLEEAIAEEVAEKLRGKTGGETKKVSTETGDRKCRDLSTVLQGSLSFFETVIK